MKSKIKPINYMLPEEKEVLIFHELDPKQFKLIGKGPDYIKLRRLFDRKEFDLRR